MECKRIWIKTTFSIGVLYEVCQTIRIGSLVGESVGSKSLAYVVLR